MAPKKNMNSPRNLKATIADLQAQLAEKQGVIDHKDRTLETVRNDRQYYADKYKESADAAVKAEQETRCVKNAARLQEQLADQAIRVLSIPPPTEAEKRAKEIAEAAGIYADAVNSALEAADVLKQAQLAVEESQVWVVETKRRLDQATRL